MVWAEPNWLFGLWVLVPLGGLFLVRHRRVRAAAAGFADPPMQARLLPALRAAGPLRKFLLFGGGTVLALLALARPRWGAYYEELRGRGVDLFVCLDVSRSMLAADVKPSRLERAKADILDLLEAARGDRVGLILFAGRPVVKCPLTLDYGFFRQQLRGAGPDDVPVGGTLIGDALRAARRAFGEKGGRERVIVLITDGEDHDSFPLQAAAELKEAGIRVVAVGLGDPAEGGRVPTAPGSRKYLTYKGQVVWSRLDEETLREIALRTGGVYVPARTRTYNLGRIYREHLAGLEREEAVGRKRKRLRDRFQLFLGPALLLLLWEAFLPWYPRRRVR